MTGAQLRQALRRLGVSQMELSRRLRVAPSTVRRWIANRTRVPEAVALLLKEWLPKRRARRRHRPATARRPPPAPGGCPSPPFSPLKRRPLVGGRAPDRGGRAPRALRW